MNSLRTMAIILIALLTVSQTQVLADLVVQWGTAGGDTGILTSGTNTDGQSGDLPLVFNGSAVNPANGTSGYDTSAAGRTNVFAGAASHTVMPDWFVNNASGDYMQLVHNFGGGGGTFETMLAWDSSTFLNPAGQLESFQVEYRDRDGNGSSTVQFLLETSAGWYISDQSDTDDDSNNDWDLWQMDAANLTFSAFSDFGVSAGSGAADISDIQSVGLFSSSPGTNNWSGNFVRNFQVSAIPEPSSLSLLGIAGGAILRRRKRSQLARTR